MQYLSKSSLYFFSFIGSNLYKICLILSTLYVFFFFLQLRYLELLKLRFGESHLHFCEIMLKDVADSRRINSHIQASAKNADNKKVFGADLLNFFNSQDLTVNSPFPPIADKISL